MRLGQLGGLLKDTLFGWFNHSAFQLAAAMAYYALFSIAPLLLIAIWMAGLVFGVDAARAGVMRQIAGLVGETGASGIGEIVRGVQDAEANRLAGLVGVVVMLFGASGVFGQLKLALNTIWGAEAPQHGLVLSYLRDRFLSFAMVLVIGFLLLVSLMVSAALSGAGEALGARIELPPAVLSVVNFLVSTAVIGGLFALLYKVLPDQEIDWGDVWVGGIVTSLLFALGKGLIGLYLGNSSVASAYGAAGSLAVVLIWIYYSSQLVLFGAEFTQVYANRRGSRSQGRGKGRPERKEKVHLGLHRQSPIG
jgi:membrane protein